MTQGPVELEDTVLEPEGQRVEGAVDIVLAVAIYRRLRILVEQGIGTFKGPIRELALERVEQVSNLGQHHLLSINLLEQFFDAPMRHYLAVAVIRPRRMGRLLISRHCRQENGLLEIKVRLRRSQLLRRHSWRREAACGMAGSSKQTLGHPYEGH